jgi:spermidine synthase
VYSYQDLYHNFRTAFENIPLNTLPDHAQVLVLGMGMGSIPHLLEHTFQKKEYVYTLVELDPVVVALAQKYTLPLLRSKYFLEVGDAYNFVVNNSKSTLYELICVDIFIDENTPSLFEKAEFLSKVKQLLAPKGLLVYNRLCSNASQKETTNQFITSVFELIFPNYQIIEAKHNRMLIGFN